MPVVINTETGKWEVQCAYSDNLGRRVRKHKRGFSSEEDALAWEQDFLKSHGGSMSTSFAKFCELYLDDNKGMLKPSTLRARRYAMEGHFVPCFGSMRMHDIRSVDIHRWQGSLVDKGYSATYLRTLRNQLSAIFNHAVAHYGLSENPVSKEKPIGAKQAVEMQVWTKEEHKRFSEAIMDKPQLFMAFEILYWCDSKVEFRRTILVGRKNNERADEEVRGSVDERQDGIRHHVSRELRSRKVPRP